MRYADDFLLGLAGPKAEAEEIKARLATFLGTQLNLTLVSEKTYVPHPRTERVRFLGYDIGIMENETKFDYLQRRVVNGGVSLYIPKDVIERKRRRLLRNGKIMHRAELTNDSEYSIITRYQWEYCGLVEYYAMALNLANLAYLWWTMETSLLKTLANKNRTRASKTHKRLYATSQTPHGPRKCLKLTISREGKKPLTAIFGGLSLKRRPYAAIKDQVLLPYIPYRSEMIDRLLRGTCEVCGKPGEVEMHHIRKLAT